MNFSCHLGIIALTTGINCTRNRSCNYFACCSCNYSQIALESMWLPICIGFREWQICVCGPGPPHRVGVLCVGVHHPAKQVWCRQAQFSF